MSILFVDAPTGLARGPACAICGGPTRLAGVEPHPRLARTDLWTYECAACDESQVVAVPIPIRTNYPAQANAANEPAGGSVSSDRS